MTLEQLEQRTLLCGDDLFDDPEVFPHAGDSWSDLSAEPEAPQRGLNIAAASTTLAVSSAIAADAQYIVHQPPRLQLGDAPLTGFPGSTTDQVDLLWETIPAGTGVDDSFNVQYRAVGQPDWLSAHPITTIDTGVEGRIIHSSVIDGLAYDSDYEYRVQHLRATALIATYQEQFHTRLPTGNPAPFTFVAYGDSAVITANSGFRSVQNRINQIDPQFAVLLGDNIYNDGSHQQADARFDPTLNPEAAQWNASHIDYLGFGNHELQTSLGQPTEELFAVPIPAQGLTSSVQPPTTERPEHNYSFDYGNVHFLTFDANSESNPTRLNALLTWAEQDLQASSAQWKIVFVHHPIAGVPDKTQDPTDNYYQQVVPRLRAAGVDLFLTGHSHTYSWTYPLLGQIGGQATYVTDTDRDYAKGAGLIQVVSGVGGKELRAGDYAQFPYVVAGFTSSTNPPSEAGFTQIAVTPAQLTVSYVAASDGHVLDSFRITDQSVTSHPVTVSLRDGLDGYQGTRDTRILGDQPTIAYGKSTKLELDGNPDKISLVRWDTSGIPTDNEVIAASITLNVTSTSVDQFEVYEALRHWEENTASYQLAATGKPWEVAGAAGATDHAADVLTTVTGPHTGLNTFDLNAQGLSVIQKWISDPSRNNGLVIQDLTDQTADGLDFSAREAAGLGPTLSITYRKASVPAPNHPPTANNQSVTTNEDTTKSVTLTGSDPDGDALHFSLESSPSNGALTGTIPNLTYQPKNNFNGSDSFRFRVNDGSSTSVVATVSIVVNPVNDPPKASPLTITTVKDTAVPITLTATDADNDVLSYFVATNPASGSLTGAAPNLTYTPNTGFIGTDSFKYQAKDATSTSTTATVTINVGAANNAVSVSFQNGMSPSPSYTGTSDTKIDATLPTGNFATATTLGIDGNPNTAALLKWDISQIPAGSSIQSASLTLDVVNKSLHKFNVYQILQPWVEGTATYNNFDTGKAWQVTGAQGSLDRGNTVLGTVYAPTLGSVTIPLNSAGVSMIQAWVNGSAQNNGLTIQNYSNSHDDKMEVTSEESSNLQARPKLTVVYAPASGSPSKAVAATATRPASSLTNSANPYDVNHDAAVSSRDALIVINYLNRNQDPIHAEAGPEESSSDIYPISPDVSGDAVISSMDVLLVINYLNNLTSGLAEGESPASFDELLSCRSHTSMCASMSTLFVPDGLMKTLPESLPTIKNSKGTVPAINQGQHSSSTAMIDLAAVQQTESYLYLSIEHDDDAIPTDLDLFIDDITEMLLPRSCSSECKAV